MQTKASSQVMQKMYQQLKNSGSKLDQTRIQSGWTVDQDIINLQQNQQHLNSSANVCFILKNKITTKKVQPKLIKPELVQTMRKQIENDGST